MIACHSLISRTAPFSATVATLPLSTVPAGETGRACSCAGRRVPRPST